MKFGYSLFLNEYIYPHNIDYEDCRTFQIVCPECKEPVYKVNREEIHYFSHYKKDETLNEQCELRVNRIAQETFISKNQESRNQKLSYFLQVFKDIIWKNEYQSNDIKKAKQQFYKLKGCNVFTSLKRFIFDYIRKNIEDKKEIFDYFDEAIENIFDNEAFKKFKSKYSILVQKDFAYQFLQHILAGHSKDNYYFLMNLAYIKYFEKLRKKVKENTASNWQISLYNSMLRFLNTQNEKKRMKIFEQLGIETMISPYTNEKIDLFIMLGSQISYNVYGMLLRIPYLQILEDKVKTKDIRSSID